MAMTPEAHKLLTDKSETILAVANDPFVQLVMRHLITRDPQRDAVDYPDVDWDKEILKHVREKFGCDEELARLGQIMWADRIFEGATAGGEA